MSPVRTLIADDSSTVRHLLTAVLSRDPDIEVVGCAPEAEALTIGQDEATPTIHGMPRAAAEVSAVVRQLPLEAIGSELVRHRRARH